MAKRKSVTAEPASSEPAGEKNANTTENGIQQEQNRNIGTTEALFGVQEQIPEQSESVPEKKEEIAEEQKASPAEPQPEEFYLEDVLAKNNIPLDKVKSRIKVDGKEEVISFDEFKKRVQLKTHLDQAGQELGRQRREILELRKGQEKERPQISSVPVNADPNQQRAPTEYDPYFSAIERRLAEIEARTAPVVYDTNRQQLIKELKAEGFDDAAEYLPRIELEIQKVQDPDLQAHYDTILGAKSLAYRLKSQDLIESMKKREEAPKAAPLERPKPPIQKIDGGSQPTTVNDIDDWQSKRDELYGLWIKEINPIAKRKLFRQLLDHQNVLAFK